MGQSPFAIANCFAFAITLGTRLLLLLDMSRRRGRLPTPFSPLGKFYLNILPDNTLLYPHIVESWRDQSEIKTTGAYNYYTLTGVDRILPRVLSGEDLMTTTFIFHASGQITGQGVDTYGTYTIEGRTDGRIVRFRKSYMHNVWEYLGMVIPHGMAGQWCSVRSLRPRGD
jgi:hypothetical protein